MMAWALSQVVPRVVKGCAPGITQNVGADRLKVALAGLALHADERAQTFISAQTLGEYMIPDSTPKGQRNAGHLAIAGLLYLGLIEELPSAGNAPRVLQLTWPDRMRDSSQETSSAITSAITSAIKDMPSSRANVMKYGSKEVLTKSLSTFVSGENAESFSEASETAESELSISERFALAEQRREQSRLQEEERQRVIEARRQADKERKEDEAGKERRQRTQRLASWLAQVAENRGHAEAPRARAHFQSEAQQTELEPLATVELLDSLNRAGSLTNVIRLLAPLYEQLSPALLQELRK